VYNTRPGLVSNLKRNEDERIFSNQVDPAGRRHFAVCVPPLHSEYDKPSELIEFLEFNFVLGASHVFLYNFSIGETVRKLLEFYERETIRNRYVSIVEWPLTLAVKMLDTHNFAQVSQINECLLRSTSRYEYAVFTNLDEFIVPRSLEFHNWNLLYENYFTKQNSAAYYFTNVFFKTEWPDDPIYSQNKTIKSLQSRILLKTNRDEWLNLEGKGTRTKMIVKTEWVEKLDVQKVADFTGNKGQPGFTVPVTVGLLHHYRFTSQPQDSNYIRDSFVPDHFANELIPRISAVHEHIQKRTSKSLPPLDTSDFY